MPGPMPAARPLSYSQPSIHPLPTLGQQATPSAVDQDTAALIPLKDLSNRFSAVALVDHDKWVKTREAESPKPGREVLARGRQIADQEILDAAEDLITEVNRCDSVPDSAIGDMGSRPSSSQAGPTGFVSDAFDSLYEYGEVLLVGLIYMLFIFHVFSNFSFLILQPTSGLHCFEIRSFVRTSWCTLSFWI